MQDRLGSSCRIGGISCRTGEGLYLRLCLRIYLRRMVRVGVAWLDGPELGWAGDGDEAAQQLVAMGFTLEQAREALDAAGGR